MPVDFSFDPRTELVRQKYFSMRPRGLERWLWQQQLPRAAERVFWLHWDAGHRNRTWCSQIPIRLVAEACCLDPATVTRAYQLLQKLGLLRRETSGRDPTCPFQQPVALTEVRIPRALLVELAREPNRRQRDSGNRHEPLSQGRAEVAVAPARADLPVPASIREVQALFARLSAGERLRFHEASLARACRIEFDADTRLSLAEQSYLLNSLGRQSRVPSLARMPAHTGVAAQISVRRPLSPMDLARIRRRVGEQERGPRAGILAREVAWAVGEGALARFGPSHGLNIALKKIREGTWTRPHRMPPNAFAALAPLESCGAA